MNKPLPEMPTHIALAIDQLRSEKCGPLADAVRELWEANLQMLCIADGLLDVAIAATVPSDGDAIPTGKPEPGDLISVVGCPECGAELQVEYGDDDGEVCVVLIRTGALWELRKKAEGRLAGFLEEGARPDEIHELRWVLGEIDGETAAVTEPQRPDTETAAVLRAAWSLFNSTEPRKVPGSNDYYVGERVWQKLSEALIEWECEHGDIHGPHGWNLPAKDEEPADG